QGAPWEWNQPFLNLVVACDTSHTPEQLLAQIKQIEQQLQRDNQSRWSPRPIDIDILLWGDQIIDTELLCIPHRSLHQRHFVLTPLIALNPQLTIPGRGDKTVLQWSESLPHHIPLWMGILNITPDSFSDGGTHNDPRAAHESVTQMVDWGASILDIGGESTRPGADTIDPALEWQRVRPVIEFIANQYSEDPLRPLVSLDTRNASVAANALPHGVDFINDVAGLRDPEMLVLASDNNCQWIAMHSLSVPADPNIVIAADADPVAEVCQWIEQQMELWDKAGIELSRLIIDPGIGFGKDPLQSLKLLQSTAALRKYGLRLLIGHSRKSFMKQFAGPNTAERDMVTVGSAMQLCQQGVDIIRVHNIPDHIAAYRGWAHLAG
ncbi:MAG: dihydropteroate synthase, partial [Pseudomonadota bacterium]